MMDLLLDNWEAITGAIIAIAGTFFGLKLKGIRDLIKEGLEAWQVYREAKADGTITAEEQKAMDEAFGEFFDKLKEAISLFKKKGE